jgi:hypothetical protein
VYRLRRQQLWLLDMISIALVHATINIIVLGYNFIAACNTIGLAFAPSAKVNPVASCQSAATSVCPFTLHQIIVTC